MASNMRGLQQYISDIRACRVRELEEKRINREMAHIRQKFKEGNLDGYQKKKYLSKVVFTYILGYKVDVGHMEAVNLISSTKYSEKQIGYLALTLLMHENSELVRLVINSIRKDLDDHNEVNNCLALHAIANIGGKEMAEALAADVHRLLISPVSPTFVKKKAALTLLRLYRKHPDVIPSGDWAERIVSIMDDEDLGVALAVTSLIMTLAQENLEAYQTCYKKAANRLHHLLFDGSHPADYVYYRVPIPWLQVKLLRLLQYYPPTDDPTVRLTITTVLTAIMENSRHTPKNVQHNNTQNAILFEAINLSIHLDPIGTSPLIASASALLGRFILSKETNVRYLGLDAMAHLAACSDSLEPVKKHQATIILSLRDRDISVRRRALDLLYSMCDGGNAMEIVGELLRYLQVADYGLREEMVLKIAILTEKFATEYEWYVDTILELISLAGDHVADEVWYRVVQIVTNTEDLQAYASKVVFTYLKAPTAHEKLVKPAAYILGEFGHLIANDEGCSPIEQFQALHSKINFCSASTRALLLSTYVKWANLFPEIKDQLVTIFDRYRHVLDAELQQRACEYLAIVTRADDDELLQAVFEEMPPFPARESALINRLHKKGKDTEDKRTWVIGGREENKEREAARLRNYKKGSNGESVPASPVVEQQQQQRESVPQHPPPPPRADTGDLMMMGVPSGSAAADDIMDSLAGLDLTSTSAQQAPLLSPTSSAISPSPSNPAASSASPTSPNLSSLGTPTFTGLMTSSTTSPASNLSPLTHGANITKWLDRLSHTAEGVLYEDATLQIGLKSEYHGHLGRIQLYFGNKLSLPLQSFTITLENPLPSSLSATLAQAPGATVAPLTQVQQQVHVECKDFFREEDAPRVRVSWLAGSLQSLVLRLPVVVSKFVEPVKLGQADFFERWKLIGGPSRESQVIFPIKLDANDMPDVAKNNKIISGNKLGLLEGIDPNPLNAVAAGVLHMSLAGKVGCLLRLEPNKDAKLCRLTIRSTNEDVSAEIQRLIARPLRAD